MIAAVLLNWALLVPRVVGNGASVMLGARGEADLEGRVSAKSLGSDVGLFFDNDLEGPDSKQANSSYLILHGDRDYATSKHACELLNEQIWSPDMPTVSLERHLNYLTIVGGRPKDLDLFWISGTRAIDGRNINEYKKRTGKEKYPVICTNTAPFSRAGKADIGRKWQVVVDSNHQLLVGYRDRRSFVFKGIRYAEKPEKWRPSKVLGGSSRNRMRVMATEYGDICAQRSGNKIVGSEDCLSLNIWTPHLPYKGAKSRTNIPLKPVLFWIHGGSFVSGTGAETTFDGGNMASRGDVVVVTFNYRLGNLGFLALRKNDQHQTLYGNYGLSDVITALTWVRDHIHDFGGDKDRITAAGQSAGAAMVRALLASKTTEGKFQRAIMMSGLGGDGDAAKPYSVYKSVQQSDAIAGSRILAKTRCKQGDRSRNGCLRDYRVDEIMKWEPEAKWLVRDNDTLKTNNLLFTNEARSWQPNLLVGYMKDDSAAQLPVPRKEESLNAFMDRNHIQNVYSNSGLRDTFILPPTSNITEKIFTAASSVATDLRIKCSTLSTAYAGARTQTLNSSGIYLYEFNRSYPLIDYPKDREVHRWCSAPLTEMYPLGNPELEADAQMRCHSGELYYVFGNLAFHSLPDRDGKDYDFSRQVLDAWAAFSWLGEPNWSWHYLVVRGYKSSEQHLKMVGTWKDVRSQQGNVEAGFKGRRTVRSLGWRSGMRERYDGMQRCKELGLGNEFWLGGEKES